LSIKKRIYQPLKNVPSTHLFKGYLQLKKNGKAMRQLRFSFGVTIATGLAYAINWPLAFLLPIFSCMLLGLPLPKPSIKATVNNMLDTLNAFLIGLFFSLFLLKFPIIYLILLALFLFHLYYHLNRGGSFWWVLMCIMALLTLPMLANSSEWIAIGFVTSGWITLAVIWLMFFLFPDPTSTPFPPLKEKPRGYNKIAAQLALKSTLISYPLIAICISYNLTDLLIVMIFVAIFILKPELSAGVGAGMNSLISSLMGGLFAWGFYWLMVAVPEFYFFLGLLFAVTLFVSLSLFSSKATSKYYSSALITMLVVFNSSIEEGADFNAIIMNRIFLISLVIIYIFLMITLLDRFIFERPNKQLKQN
jgi:hypothetical protein